MDAISLPGLIIWATIGAVIAFVWRLLKGPSEGSRRLRLVASLAVAVLVLAMLVDALGVGGALTTAVIVGVVWWVAKGFRKAE